jgi:hypothetical protein
MKGLGILQICSIIMSIIFCCYYVRCVVKYRLWFIMSSYWNLYDLAMLILFFVSFYFDIFFILTRRRISPVLANLQHRSYQEVIPFVKSQLSRVNVQAFMAASVIVRLLRFLPHFSNLIANLLNVLYKSIRNAIVFLPLFILIFMSFVVFGTFHYGDQLYEVIQMDSSVIRSLSISITHSP